MKQKQIIQQLKNVFLTNRGIDAALLIGSFGRGTPKANSDIDIQILVNDKFDNPLFMTEINKSFTEDLRHHLYLVDKNKWCFYLYENLILIEISICYELRDIDLLYLGSEIDHPEKSILVDKQNILSEYLNAITIQKKTYAIIKRQQNVERLIVSFQTYFANASLAHSKSDGYKFFLLFSHSLNALIRLVYIYENGTTHDYMPPNFLTDYGYRLKLGIEKLGTMDLRVANQHKRELLDIFISYLPLICNKFKFNISQERTISFLEAIFSRDYFWNFRDVSKFNPKIKKGLIFRSAALCLFQNSGQFYELLEKKNIQTIVDLRAIKELQELNYKSQVKEKLSIIHTPFDPWNQSIEFKNTYNVGSNIEIAYQFFGRECKESIKVVMQAILATENAVNIHCHAGKDRTGIVVSILHLLSEADFEVIMLDYLASEMDTTSQYIEIFLKIVEDEGGVNKYLKSCGLSQVEVNALKNKICV